MGIPPEIVLFYQNSCIISSPPPKVYFFSKRAYNIEYFFDLFGWAKNVNIRQYDTLFYQFLGKITALMPIFCQKTSILQETRCSNDHILSKKRPFCKKIRCSHAIIFIFFKTPCYHAHISSKKRQNCQNYKILWAKKVNSMSFFPILHEKMTFFMPIFYQKNIYFLKNTNALIPTLCQKKRQFSQKHSALMSYLSNFS